MKGLMKYASRYWYLYLIALGSMLISILLDVMAPQITKRIIDDVIVGGQMQILMQLLLALIGIGFGRAIFQYIKEFLFDVAGIRIGSQIRKNLFRHVQTLSMGYFDTHNTGEVMARIKDDVDRIWNAMGFVGMLIIECLVHTGIVLTCMFMISPTLTIIPLALMPLIAYSAVRMEGRLGTIYEDISEQTARLNTVAQENLAGVRTVKAFAREDYEIDKFKTQNKRFYQLNMEQAKVLVKYQPNISFLTKLLLMAVIVIGGIMVIEKKITIGELGAFSEYANNIIWPMEMVGWLSNDFASAMASNRKINKVLAETPDIQTPSDPVVPDRISGHLEFKHVEFKLHDAKILSDIDFDLQPGKTLGIMGVTGSGKSSIVNLIQRFYDVSKGEILLDGIDIRTLPLELLRSHTAVVMQDVFLFSDSVLENIKTGNKEHITFDTARQSAEYADAHEFIERLGSQYDTVVGERGVGLSGGQKQRISIARAVAKETPILILDDATSALDMETEHSIQGKIQSLQKASKIIIAHRISAVKNADEILILEGGRIVERGTHESLMASRGEYFKTYQVQYGEEVASWQ